MCPIVRILTWCSSKQVTYKARHIPGQLNVIEDKLLRLGQTIQTDWSLLPKVFQSICSQWHQPQVDLFSNPPIFPIHSICITCSRPPSIGSGCTQSDMGDFGPVCLSIGSHLDGEVAGLPMQENHSDCTRVAQHALVLGPSGHVESNPVVPAQPTQSVDSTIQSDPSQKFIKSESSCLASRASAIKERGFKEDQPDESMWQS